MKKIFILTTGIILCLNHLAGAFIQGKPQLVVLKYSSSDVPIVSYLVTAPPYNADSTGVSDATNAIQNAINDCGKNLGGVVFIPAGKYRIDHNLLVKRGVTLRGDWAQPTTTDKKDKQFTINSNYYLVLDIKYFFRQYCCNEKLCSHKDMKN